MDATPLATLMDACKAGELSLPSLLVDELARRGAVAPAQHTAELQWLAQTREAGIYEAAVVQLVVERLTALQATVLAGDGVGQPTMVMRAGTPVAAGDDEATCVAPIARAVAAPPTAPDQATVVQPASAESADAGTAGVQAASHVGRTGSSVDASDWRRVADAASGDQAIAGMLLKGRFQLERELGRGGMGVVFLARDERKVEARDRDPYVAIKVLNDEFRRHPDSLIALQRESRRSQQLAHDNIVRVFDFDKDRTIVFMTMEYVDGCDLRTLIRERAARGMPLARARPLIEGMARALKRAHDAGVVHSDFKPANVMITREGNPKVFDFGIARAGKKPGEAEDQTVFDAGKLGAMTPAYASLEMIAGQPPQPTDDIYALGCVTFELLTGKHPFNRLGAEAAARERLRPPAVPGLTRRQYRTLCDAVAFTADRRLQSADQLIDGLRRVGWGERAGRPLAYAVVGVLLLVAVGWAAFGQWRTRQVAAVIARLQPGSAQRYADEAQAIAALAALDENTRRQLMLDQGDLVQQFLLDRVDAYWNPAGGRRDYAAAQRVFALPGQLHLFLPRLDLRRITVDKEKRDLEQSKAATAALPPRPAPAAISSTPAGSPVVLRAPPHDRPASQASALAVRATSAPPAATQTPAKPDNSPAVRMRQVAAGLLHEGERNFAQQNYSAAIANARAALQVDPGDAGAKRLLRRAEQAQQQAMSSISIN